MKHQVVLQPRGLRVTVHEGEVVSDAAKRAGITLPLSCRNGVCEVCAAELHAGTMALPQGTVTGNQTKPPTVLLCRARPLSPCELEIANILGPGELPLKTITCQIESVAPIQAHVFRVVLRLPAGRKPEFYAGQYLALQLPEKEAPCFYSIASAPGGDYLELHIQADPHLASANEVIAYLQQNTLVRVALPHGRACMTEVPQQDVVMLAAGTGFAQMKSMIEYLLAADFSHHVYLYWGVRQAQDMYLKADTEAWAALNPRFHFSAVIADIDDVEGIEHHDQLSETVLRDQHDLSRMQVYVAGSPRLVFSALDRFEAAGLPTEQFFSDVLEYMERPEPGA